MSWGDTLVYLTIGNPFSQALLNSASAVLHGSGLKAKHIQDVAPKNLPPPKPLYLCDIAGRNYYFVRLAGLSGATAVIMGAYGKHNLNKIIDPNEQLEAKQIFETANRFHFLHSIALLAIPMARRPLISGGLMFIGTVFFSGTMYYRALTGDTRFKQISPFGGFCLIAAWLSLIF